MEDTNRKSAQVTAIKKSSGTDSKPESYTKESGTVPSVVTRHSSLSYFRWKKGLRRSLWYLPRLPSARSMNQCTCTHAASFHVPSILSLPLSISPSIYIYILFCCRARLPYNFRVHLTIVFDGLCWSRLLNSDPKQMRFSPLRGPSAH